MVPGVFMLMLCLIPAIMSAIARRAREGDRLDRQFPIDADHEARVPARQATALCRRRHGEFLRSAVDGAVRLQCAGQRAVPAAADRHVHLCDRARPASGNSSPPSCALRSPRCSRPPSFRWSPRSIFPACSRPCRRCPAERRCWACHSRPPGIRRLVIGVFTKALGYRELWTNLLAMAVIALVYLALSLLLLRKQEA